MQSLDMLSNPVRSNYAVALPHQIAAEARSVWLPKEDQSVSKPQIVQVWVPGADTTWL